MFLVPALLTLLFLLFEPSVLTDTRPDYGWWALMWIVAKVGFFVWVLRQLLKCCVSLDDKAQKNRGVLLTSEHDDFLDESPGSRSSLGITRNHNLAKRNPLRVGIVKVLGEVTQN